MIPCGDMGDGEHLAQGIRARRWRPRQDILAHVGEPMRIEGRCESPAMTGNV